MIKINIIYDETIDKEYFSQAIGITCINCCKSIDFLLDDKHIKDFITPFVTNMVFQHITLFWIIQSNKNLNLDLKNHCPYWILNVAWYNTTICS